MKITVKMMFAVLLGLGLVGLVSSCEKTPAEKVAQKVDKAVQDTRDAVHDAKDDLSKKR